MIGAVDGQYIYLEMVKLSSYTQYYIRKLLQQLADRFGYPHTGVGLQNSLQADLDLLLSQRCSQIEIPQRVQELERLVELHCKAKLPFQASSSLVQIEQKIFWLLGLKFFALLPDITVEVMPEGAVACFNFLLNQQLCRGMQYQGRLYGQVLEFGADYDLAACRLLFMLNGCQIPFQITASEVRHRVWIDLRFPTYRLLLKPLTTHQFAQRTDAA